MVQAKQLKSLWVQTQKIKSKWKAEKRREGLSSQRREPNEKGPRQKLRVDPEPFVEQERPVGDTPRPSLRELTKTAYASSSLHNHKSDPLHKRRGESSIQQGGIDRSRGQPNMKLRMNALLEKIKQDFA
jgi:hypothetical protein